MAILAVGSIAFDTIQTPRGRKERVLGGSVTHFSLAASFFTEVRVVGVVGADSTAEHEAGMCKRGIHTSGIERAKGKTFHWSGEYGDNLNEAKTHLTELNVFNNSSRRSHKNIWIPTSSSLRISILFCSAAFASRCRKRSWSAAIP